jgi:hypothetical protein
LNPHGILENLLENVAFLFSLMHCISQPLSKDSPLPSTNIIKHFWFDMIRDHSDALLALFPLIYHLSRHFFLSHVHPPDRRHKQHA